MPYVPDIGGDIPGLELPGVGKWDPTTGTYKPPKPPTSSTDETTGDITEITEGYFKPDVQVETGRHWDMPDYRSLALGDYGYMGDIENITAGQNTAQRNRLSAIKRAVAQFGGSPIRPGANRMAAGTGVPEYDEATWNAINEAAAFGRENPFSTTRMLEQQRAQGMESLAAKLGARGMYFSGGLAAGGQAISNDYNQQYTNKLNELLGNLGGDEAEPATTMNESGAQQRAAYEDAYGRAQKQYLPKEVIDYATQKGEWVPGSTKVTKGNRPTPPATPPTSPVDTGGPGNVSAYLPPSTRPEDVAPVIIDQSAQGTYDPNAEWGAGDTNQWPEPTQGQQEVLNTLDDWRNYPSYGGEDYNTYEGYTETPEGSWMTPQWQAAMEAQRESWIPWIYGSPVLGRGQTLD